MKEVNKFVIELGAQDIEKILEVWAEKQLKEKGYTLSRSRSVYGEPFPDMVYEGLKIQPEATMEDELRKHLRELIKMWGEVAHMGSSDGSMKIETAVRHDCMNDLKEILNGDYSCIERAD